MAVPNTAQPTTPPPCSGNGWEGGGAAARPARYYSIFPNPSSGELYVKPIDAVNAEPIERIEVYDMIGQLLMMTDRSSGEKELELDLSFIADSQLINIRIMTSENECNGLVAIVK
jgi:hypothetical protein